MVGAPHFLSITTLRPRGPSVTLTVSASLSTPRSSAERASELNSRILGMNCYLTLQMLQTEVLLNVVRAPGRLGGRAPSSTHVLRRSYLLLDDSEDVASGEYEVLLARVLDLGAAVLAVENDVPDLDVDGHALGACVVEPAGTHRQDFALLGLLLSGVRDNETRSRGLLRFKRANHDPVLKRLENNLGGGRHDLTSPSGRIKGNCLERATTAACRRGDQTASSR